MLAYYRRALNISLIPSRDARTERYGSRGGVVYGVPVIQSHPLEDVPSFRGNRHTSPVFARVPHKGCMRVPATIKIVDKYLELR